jgi:hypothetical protein
MLHPLFNGFYYTTKHPTGSWYIRTRVWVEDGQWVEIDHDNPKGMAVPVADGKTILAVFESIFPHFLRG